MGCWGGENCGEGGRVEEHDLWKKVRKTEDRRIIIILIIIIIMMSLVGFNLIKIVVIIKLHTIYICRFRTKSKEICVC